ncbi:hypothetical protein CALCODRAFT_489228 [Calocera cornea HHB12733]|uniref:Uncharacterized protein n=1 Tax=Calocera cornea HHB12733 TaxID=1353952 RepID=A0A165K6I7_9BASI|nr:hypothetical protein CALCODRAFT_489228 [Calocera cornea HHB12733]
MPAEVSNDSSEAHFATNAVDSSPPLPELIGTLQALFASEPQDEPQHPLPRKARRLINTLIMDEYNTDPGIRKLQRVIDVYELAYTLLTPRTPENTAARKQTLTVTRQARRAVLEVIAAQERQRARDEENGVRDGEHLPTYDPAWRIELEQRASVLSATDSIAAPADDSPRPVATPAQATPPYTAVVDSAHARSLTSVRPAPSTTSTPSVRAIQPPHGATSSVVPPVAGTNAQPSARTPAATPPSASAHNAPVLRAARTTASVPTTSPIRAAGLPSARTPATASSPARTPVAALPSTGTRTAALPSPRTYTAAAPSARIRAATSAPPTSPALLRVDARTTSPPSARARDAAPPTRTRTTAHPSSRTGTSSLQPNPTILPATARATAPSTAPSSRSHGPTVNRVPAALTTADDAPDEMTRREVRARFDAWAEAYVDANVLGITRRSHRSTVDSVTDAPTPDEINALYKSWVDAHMLYRKQQRSRAIFPRIVRWLTAHVEVSPEYDTRGNSTMSPSTRDHASPAPMIVR